MQGDDNTLAQRAARGDRTAFSALLARHYDLIVRIAWRWTGGQDAAEDVAQDVCIKLATAIGSFRADASFRTWLYRVVYNAAIDHIRVNQRSEATDPSDLEQMIDAVAATRSPEAEMISGEVWAAVDRLPGQQRDAILLVYGEDMSHAEAADVMGCSEKTVSWHLHEARKRLKGVIAIAG